MRKQIVILALATAVLTLAVGSAGTASAAPATNDNFADAKVIQSLPFVELLTGVEATREAREPQPCGDSVSTVWYRFTAATNLNLQADGGANVLAVYNGDALGKLRSAGCDTVPGGGPVVQFQARAGKAYHIQVGASDGHFGISLAVAQQQTVQRPIEEFVAAQGTFCVPDGSGGCLLFTPPVPNSLSWQNSDRGRCASVDYAGLANEWLQDNSNGATSLGTSFSGSVVERARDDGKADVTVTLFTGSALTWAVSGCDPNGPFIFGNRVTDVLAGAEASVGDSFLRVEFINFAPGKPLPDLIQLFHAPTGGQVFQRVSFQANAEGALREAFGVPDGTPGRAHITQRLFFVVGHHNVLIPVDNIDLHPVGQ